MNKYHFDSEQHLHKFEDKYLTGTSTVMEVLSKPLTWWASGLAVSKLGWTKAKDWKLLKTEEQKQEDLKRRIDFTSPVFEMVKGMDIESYISLLDEAYKAHSVKLDKSADAGTDMHAVLENYVKAKMEGKEAHLEGNLKCFEEWTDKNVTKFIGSETHCYSEKMWTGGITDAVAELKDGTIAIIDFKSAKDAYSSHFFQIGGYDLAITENGGFDFEGNQLFKLDKPITKHIVVPFGAKEPYPVSSDLVEEDREAFRSALSLYRIINKLNKQ